MQVHLTFQCSNSMTFPKSICYDAPQHIRTIEEDPLDVMIFSTTVNRELDEMSYIIHGPDGACDWVCGSK